MVRDLLNEQVFRISTPQRWRKEQLIAASGAARPRKRGTGR